MVPLTRNCKTPLLVSARSAKNPIPTVSVSSAVNVLSRIVGYKLRVRGCGLIACIALCWFVLLHTANDVTRFLALPTYEGFTLQRTLRVTVTPSSVGKSLARRLNIHRSREIRAMLAVDVWVGL